MGSSLIWGSKKLSPERYDKEPVMSKVKGRALKV